jgi:ubiquinone/menaquinone biosynthesis C-methylase UbiE
MDQATNRLKNCFKDEVKISDGIYYPGLLDSDKRAESTWSNAAKVNPVSAAAATQSPDYFAKFPEWIYEHIDEQVETILDAGCGYGRIAIPLLTKNPNLHLVGVDASSVMLHKFLQLSQEYELANRIALYNGNLSNLPVKDNCFDCVVSSAVILHVPYAEAKIIVKEIYRILKPGGKVIFSSSFPNIYNLEGLQNAVYEKFKSQTNGPVRVYSRQQVEVLLDGYQDVQIFPRNLVVLPRQIAKIALPFGEKIRQFNQGMTKRYIRHFMKSGLLIAYYDVVAIK